MWFDPQTKQKQKSRKIPEKFLKNPGIKNKGKSRPEKSRDPGIWQNPVPKIPGLKIWIPLGPDADNMQIGSNNSYFGEIGRDADYANRAINTWDWEFWTYGL